jgi:hypothetical protein
MGMAMVLRKHANIALGSDCGIALLRELKLPSAVIPRNAMN